MFARTYDSLEKDLSRLVDIPGHSNVSTTRIYTAESGLVHARQADRLELILINTILLNTVRDAVWKKY